MKGQDVGVGPGSEPSLCCLLFGDYAASWFYLLSESIHATNPLSLFLMQRSGVILPSCKEMQIDVKLPGGG